MAREGENANQPFNPELEAAILRAREDRQIQVDFEFDAQRRVLTLVGTPVPDPTDLSFKAPEPIRLAILFAHLKAAMGAVWQHEAGTLLTEAERLERRGGAQRDVEQMRGVAEMKVKIAGKLVMESEGELQSLRKAEAENRERNPRGTKGTLTLPEQRPLPGPPKGPIPGFDV